MDNHDHLEAQYNAIKAKQKARDHADAFMQGWNRAKLHSDTLESAFESWRVCIAPEVPAVDIMLRKLRQIRKLALSVEGHSFDLIIALADEALAAAAREGGDVQQAPGEAPQSGPERQRPPPVALPPLSDKEKD